MGGVIMSVRWLSTWWWRVGDSPAARILVQRLTALSRGRRRGHRVDACGPDDCEHTGQLSEQGFQALTFAIRTGTVDLPSADGLPSQSAT